MRIFADNHIFNLSKENYESLECKIDKDNEYDEIFYIVAIHKEDKSFDLVVTTLSRRYVRHRSFEQKKIIRQRIRREQFQERDSDNDITEGGNVD